MTMTNHIKMLLILLLGLFVQNAVTAQSGDLDAKIVSVYATDNIAKVAVNENNSTTIEIYDGAGVLNTTIIPPFDTFQIYSMDWNSNGEQLAVIYSSIIPRVVVWDVDTQQIVSERSIDFAFFVKWHPTNPSRLAIATGSSVSIIDISSDSLATSPQLTQSSIIQVEWSPDGSQIGVLTGIAELQVLDVSDFALQYQLGDETIPVDEITNWYFSFAWKPDGQKIVLFDVENSELEVWNLSQNQIELIFHSFDTTTKHNEVLAWSNYGIVGVDFGSRTIAQYDPDNGQHQIILSNTAFAGFTLDPMLDTLFYLPEPLRSDESLIYALEVK